MKLSQKYVELFLSELKLYRRLTVAEMNYYAHHHDELLMELKELRKRDKLARDKKWSEEQARLEEKRLAREEAERAEAERQRILEDERVESITCMDLPTDFENLYTQDENAELEHTDNVGDALISSLNKLARVDIEYISAITGLDYKSVILALKGAIYQNPQKWNECFYLGWETAEEYLSGSLREKLQVAIEANERYKGYFSANVRALERVIPSGLSINDIYVTLGSPWLPTTVIDDFIVYLLGDVSNRFPEGALRCYHDEGSGTWEIPVKNRYTGTRYNGRCFDTYGTRDLNALVIIEKTLNQAPIEVYDEFPSRTNPGKMEKRLNEGRTFRALEKQEVIIKAFKSWIWTSPERRAELERIYETRYSSNRVRHFDGSFLTLPGLSPDIELYPYQRNAVARILFTPNTLLAHDVGSGKTYIMIASAMELKRTGISKKNIFVVPNNLVGQWKDIFLSMYPDAKLLCVEPKSFTPKKRLGVLKQMRDEEFDGIIIAYSSFELIPFSKKAQIEALEAELAEYNKATTNLYTDRYARQKKALEKKIAELHEKTELSLGSIFFDELGISTIFIDEAHNYKNVPLHTHTGRVLGISSSGSIKCQDILNKVRYVQRTNGGRGCVLATGTPITNSITDAFIMQKFLQDGELKLLGLSSFDGWIGMFAEKHTDFEIDVDTSSYRLTTRFSRFHNLPELTKLLASVADFHVVDQSDGVPLLDGYTDCVCSRSSEFKGYLKVISARAEDVRSRRVPRTEDNMLLITTDGRKAALDMRLIDDTIVVSGRSSKAQACADNAFDIYKRYELTKSTQLIFCDYSTPKATFNLYDEIRTLLVAKGVPYDEIAFVHSATTPASRDKLFEAVRRGEIRILIGSTFKLGLGVNVQDKLIAIHHLDVPWRPADMTQREGRILRQGNENERVFIFRYITKGSFDAYSWQLLETKQRFISSILCGHMTERSGSDVCDTVLSYAEVKALAVGNPLIKKRVEIANELDRLSILKRERILRFESLKLELEALPSKIEAQEVILERARLDMAFLGKQEAPPELSPDERRAFRERLEIALRSNTLASEERELFEYRGFMLVLGAGMKADEPFIWLKREGKYHLELGEASLGYLPRINNFLDSFKKHLERLEEGYEALINRRRDIEIALSERDEYSQRIEELKAELQQLDKKLGVTQ